MRPSDRSRAAALSCALSRFDGSVRPLPGARSPTRRSCLVEQVIDSLRRIEFAHFVRDHSHDPRRMDPATDFFDPLRAAAFAISRATWMRLRGLFFSPFTLGSIPLMVGASVEASTAALAALCFGIGPPYDPMSKASGHGCIKIAKRFVAMFRRCDFSNHKDIEPRFLFDEWHGRGGLIVR